MKRLLVLSLMAIVVPAASAGTATFGLFSHYGHCGSCSACPGPWNAFSPRGCCVVENANGCTQYPCGYHGNPYIAGGHPMGVGHHCGPFGCGLFGSHSGYGWDPAVPYPYGVAGAWHGQPGMGGCADPFGGCGTAYKPTLKDKLANCFKGSASAPPEHLSDYFGGKFQGGHLGLGHGFGGLGHSIGGGCPNCDAPVTVPAPAAPTGPVTTLPPAATQPVSYQQPVGYAYPNSPAMYYYYPGYGYYPSFAYPSYGR